MKPKIKKYSIEIIESDKGYSMNRTVAGLIQSFIAQWVLPISHLTPKPKGVSTTEFCICPVPNRESGYSYCSDCHKHVSDQRMEILTRDTDISNVIPKPKKEESIDDIDVFCEQHAITPNVLIDVYKEFVKQAVDSVQSAKGEDDLFYECKQLIEYYHGVAPDKMEIPNTSFVILEKLKDKLSEYKSVK